MYIMRAPWEKYMDQSRRPQSSSNSAEWGKEGRGLKWNQETVFLNYP